MRIAIIGTRGIPANHGGFETFAQEISYEWSEQGHEVIVVGDESNNINHKKYLKAHTINSKYSKPNNPLLFYYESYKLASSWGAEIIVCCGVGGTIFSRLFQSRHRIIFNNPDGLGFLRDKYSLLKKIIFKSQYLLSAITEKFLICDSEGIKKYYEQKLFKNKGLFVAEYGTVENQYLNLDKKDFSRYFPSLNQGEYYLVVSRLEPENNLINIINGYNRSKSKKPLIIVGNLNTTHSKKLILLKNKNILFLGGIYNKEKLQILRANAFAYLHGHSVGGTNPSLLEAMGSRNLCICHKNIFNEAVVRDNGFYFENPIQLSEVINKIERDNPEEINNLKEKTLKIAKTEYSWAIIANKYLNIFNTVKNDLSS